MTPPEWRCWIIWPDKRGLTAAQVRSMYQDAVANGELDFDDCTFTEPDEQAMALHSAGLITMTGDGTGFMPRN